LEHIEQQAHLEVTVQIATFLGAERFVLVFPQKFVQALAVLRVELDLEQRPSRRCRQVPVFRLDRPR
jgi:hypothetical protein